MRRAYVLIRQQPWYRRQAFETGLKQLGYEVLNRSPDRPAPSDVLVIWNRYNEMHQLALRVERAGGQVLVAENGYVGAGGGTPKFQVHPAGPQPDHYYALSQGWHNGRGRSPYWGVEPLDARAGERWERLRVRLKPWRTEGEHVLVCPNRSFGVGEQVMHADWALRCVERLKKQTRRPVRLRAHPGNDAPKRALAEDLKSAWAVVVWSSSVAVHALIEGIPAYFEAPYQIVKGAAASGPVDAPVCPERRPHFERLAWAQWTCREIESGEPFRHLLKGPAA